jgi:hypothetical protein
LALIAAAVKVVEVVLTIVDKVALIADVVAALMALGTEAAKIVVVVELIKEEAGKVVVALVTDVVEAFMVAREEVNRVAVVLRTEKSFTSVGNEAAKVGGAVELIVAGKVALVMEALERVVALMAGGTEAAKIVVVVVSMTVGKEALITEEAVIAGWKEVAKVLLAAVLVVVSIALIAAGKPVANIEAAGKEGGIKSAFGTEVDADAEVEVKRVSVVEDLPFTNRSK